MSVSIPPHLTLLPFPIAVRLFEATLRPLRISFSLVIAKKWNKALFFVSGFFFHIRRSYSIVYLYKETLTIIAVIKISCLLVPTFQVLGSGCNIPATP